MENKLRNHMGELYVVEGGDGSGKNTQARRLVSVLEETKPRVKLISFPNYKDESSAMVKRYLSGGFNNTQDFVDSFQFIKQMSAMYAIDRIATFHQADPIEGISPYQMLHEGWTLVCDRYTTSNILHQSANLENDALIPVYIHWIQRMEFIHFGLPTPNIVFFLDLPANESIEALKHATEKKRLEGAIVDNKDILENIEHLQKVESVKDAIIDLCNWVRIPCMESGHRLPELEVHKRIMQQLML